MDFMIDCSTLESVTGMFQIPEDDALIDCIVFNRHLQHVQKAAVKIQAWSRMVLVRRVYLKTKELIKYANTIKTSWRMYMNYKKTMKLCSQNSKERMKNWKEKQHKFINT